VTDEEVETFDQELDRLLREIAPEPFTILHEMVIQVFVRKGELMSEL
jgi:division protein CdvB (Snf7/Vps24/ESCRT-III family)